MPVRRIIKTRKAIGTATKWSSKDLPPKHAPIYPRTKPIRAGWRWRSSRVEDETKNVYVLLAECNPKRDNWKAVLILDTSNGPSVVARFEHHGSHPGIHAHADCDRGGIEVGTKGLDNLIRFPAVGSVHRRTNAWTENTFWEAAKHFFRIEDKKGPLI